MKTLFYITAFILIAISVFFNVSAYAAGGSGTDGSGSWTPLPDPSYPGGGGGFNGGGSGGSWGNSGGFGGNGGIGSSQGSCTFKASGATGWFPTGSAACSAVVGWNLTYNASRLTCDNSNGAPISNVTRECSAPPTCPSGQYYNGSQCVPELKCPAGYKKEGDKCVWQCPVGMKLVGGNCVKDDQPEDCDPAIQQCDDDGKPVCNICEKLTNIMNNQTTNINNDNRVISLTETMVANQNTTNNNINNVNNSLSVINNNMNTVNNNISNVNNNLTTINESIENIITTIENNKPDFDTSGIEAKLQQLIDKDNADVNVDLDLTDLLLKLDEIQQAIIDNKYDDTELKAKIDELINKDLSPITDRQDEQTGLLEDIKKLLMPTNEAGDPSFTPPEIETPENSDLWGAIRGFDIHQNRINASKQCPPDKEFEINLLTVSKTLAIPMGPMCDYASYLAPIFLMLAYFSGAMIILKAGD